MPWVFLLFVLWAEAAEREGIRHLPEQASLLELKPNVFLSPRELPELGGECQNCHLKKAKSKIQAVKKLKAEHQQFQPHHGGKKIPCGSCHDVNNHNYLRSNKHFPAGFQNSSPVCQQCHADRYRDWLGGLHGKRTGMWIAEQTQLHCIDCHDPHSVSFKPMEAIATPLRPGHVAEAEEE